MSVGMQCRHEIEAQVKAAMPAAQYLRIGDCREIGNALKAFQAGWEAADQI